MAKSLEHKLDRLVDLLERLVPAPETPVNFDIANAFIWQSLPSPQLLPVVNVNHVPLSLLQGIDRNMDIIVENTRRFAQGYPANNVLLWGARGMGKSSLVKAVHADINNSVPKTDPGKYLKLIEIHREDIETLPLLMSALKSRREQFIIFCDDLSFDGNDTSYKSLKAALDGGIEGRPANVLFYATSNRRHLMPRDMMENERSTSISPSETVEEKVSLSDRFGLWVGFYNCTQDDYIEMVKGYARHYAIKINDLDLNKQSLEWSTTRGSRSGRVAFQFIQDLRGRHASESDQT
ncbi:MAG: ATP-binding protein [Cohaesibacteraceae bacterium]|nr:ATP-binding protein [Cohaesibacteraceae bacterium]